MQSEEIYQRQRGDEINARPDRVLKHQQANNHDLNQELPAENLDSEHKCGEEKILKINAELETLIQQRTAELQTANNWLAGIINSNNDIIAALDTNFNFIAFNQAYQKEFKAIFGVDIQIGANLADSIAHLPTEQKKAIAIWQRALNGEKFVITEDFGIEELQRNYYELSFNPIKNESGKIIGASHIVRDVTTKKQAQKQIENLNIQLEERVKERTQQLEIINQSLEQEINERKRSEARFRSLIFATAQAVWTCNPKGEFIEPQPSWQVLTGQTQAEYSGWGWLEAIHPDDRPTTVKRWQNATSSAMSGRSMPQGPYEDEYRIKTTDGTYRHFTTRAVPVFNDNGIIEEWVGIHTDITHRVEAETALRESESRLRVAQKAAKAGTWDWDILNNTVSWSEEYYQLYGLDFSTEPSYENWMNCIYPEDREKIHSAIFSALETQNEITLEFRVLHPKDIRWFYSLGEIFRNEAGEPSRMIGIVFDLTQRWQLEEALRISEERFRQFAENINDVLWVSNIKQGQLLYVSPAYEEIWGRSSQSLYTNYFSWIEAIHPQDQPRVLEEFEKQVAGENYDTEYRVVRPDGSIRWIRDRGFPITGSSGEPDRAAGIAEDITERRNAEIALQQALERVLLHVDNSPLAVVEWDANWQVVRWSSGSERIFGWKSEEVLGKTFTDWEFVYPEDLPTVRDFILQIKENRQTKYFCINRNYTKQGSVISCEWYNSTLKDENGNITSVLSFALDITERERMQQSLQVNRERLDLILDASQLGLWYCDLPFSKLQWNSKCKEHFGLSPETEVTIELFYNTLHPDDRESTRIAIEQSINNHSEFDIDYRTIGQDGKMRWVRAIGRAFYDQNGIGRRFDGITIDITERKKAEAEKEELLQRERCAREQAETANRIKDEFLAVLSHELRSPLNPILGWAKLLRSRTFSREATNRALETIERNAKLQTQLIEDLLDVSRILGGKLSLQIAPTNLSTAIEAALETVRLSAEAKSISILTNLDANLGLVMGDSGRLQQVFWNLLSNAVKFTPAGGRIEVMLERGNNSAQIIVKDNGKGINPEFLPYVFDTFRQADSSITRKFGGLGLGLSIARHLVELHGGNIQAESLGEGTGATFKVELPLILSSEKIANSEEFPGVLNIAGVRILAVDDERDMLDYLGYVLESAGGVVTVVASAQEALEILQRQRFDVLVSDIGMPVMDGYELVQKLRKMNSEVATIPAIALTAYAGEYNEKQALSAGFSAHLSKPVEPDKIIESILSLVMGH
ncbi:PAS domain-containing protein [Ancylothrix sp. C2]|uniref:PAS domain-containing hybrid sensor histidine kinase/response regulator n=1 Tax=Ancylothrix sp. D3o TaxID=2953691 RepID=UPI0021BA59BC|nr:PAS domain S-box protein [Ancylothrix sp. D3o]MCT7948506.1 PAS domain-containing protein [Ancylothrix sp. D3o]